MTFDNYDHGKTVEIREQATLIDSETMGNKSSSVDVTPVSLTAIGEVGSVQKGAKKGETTGVQLFGDNSIQSFKFQEIYGWI